MSFSQAASQIQAQIARLPGVERLRQLTAPREWDDATLSEIIDTAGRFAHEVLEPFNRGADKVGCRLKDGRVELAPGHAEVWQAFVEAGWPMIEAPADYGGMGLPLLVHSACEELFNRAAPGFGMLPAPTRCAARLIHCHADEVIKQEWLPKLATGEWGGTICISEPDAGSDLARVRTLATPQADGTWVITGEKMWISFGDHPLTPRIGHMVLARTPDAPPGTGGLSLFLVPSTIGDQRNAVVTRRVEEKLGLHSSPTCALGFEGAQGWLVGTMHRGLAQLFTMIVGMRISVGSQGAAIAGAASDLAWSYAAERRQGGSASRPPVTIDEHGDVRRMLLGMAARAEVSRGLTLLASLTSDLAECEDDAAARKQAAALCAWLLPITKNFCAETAFANASEAIQVLGGAGYTSEWPAEQYLRDARVLSVYEGTTGMQALDLLLRRVLPGEGEGLQAFIAAASADLATAADSREAVALGTMLDLLESAARHLRARADQPHALQAAAVPFLQLASLATTGWIALRLCQAQDTPVERVMAARARHWLRIAPASAQREAMLVLDCDGLVSDFADASDREGMA